MNFLFISPNFPPQFYLFCTALRERGVRVLGIGDAPFHELRSELRNALAEYVHVQHMDNYDHMLRSVAYLVSRHGRIDRLDSMSEHWLGVEALLREDFNVPGLRPATTALHRSKSGMAEVFARAGIPTPRGERATSPEQVRAFVKKVGLPVVFKPDVGVGAAGAFKVATVEQLEAALARPLKDLVVQEFVPGTITTYDGLTDADGRIVFSSSFVYSSGVMEILNEGLDLFYYSRRELPPRLEALGARTVEAFGIRERFFHAEFFELADGSYRALEINLRPPGGFSTDLMNYSCDIDVYKLWAAVITGASVGDLEIERRYHAAHASRRPYRNYKLSHEELVRELGPALVAFQRLHPPVSIVMGEMVYLVRHAELEGLTRALKLIQAGA